MPRANFHNSVGYLPDGTAMNAAGNAVNHPERMQPDMHVAGSPLPKSVTLLRWLVFFSGELANPKGTDGGMEPYPQHISLPKTNSTQVSI